MFKKICSIVLSIIDLSAIIFHRKEKHSPLTLKREIFLCTNKDKKDDNYYLSTDNGPNTHLSALLI